VVEVEPEPEDEVAALPPEPAPPARAPTPPPIDLDDLERRVRSTSAIGPFTKLALKNEIDDLLDAFASYHNGNGRSGPSLAALRERFDLLVMKVVALLEDDDVRLASDLTRSREHLWGLVSDPIQFSQL
jgi:hypothetical protein